MMRIILVCLLAIGAVVLAITPPAVSLASSHAQASLVGTQWQLVSFGAPDSEASVVPDTLISLEFQNESDVVGSGGCNGYSSSYEISDESIAFGEVVSTRMACQDSQVMEQEQAYFAALQAVTHYELSDEELTLWNDEGQQLNFVAVEVLMLPGSQWQLISYGPPDDETLVIPDSLITLEFPVEGEVAGSGGCNSYGGSYESTEDSIVFNEVVRTEMACADEQITAQEQVYFDALQSITQYVLTEDGLTIWYGDGESQLNFLPYGAYALLDSRWELVSYGAPDAQTPVIPESGVTLEFINEGEAGGSGGCNSYGGSYMVEDDTIAFNNLISTLMACADTGLTEQEQVYLQALQSAVRYELSGDQLTLWYGEGQEQLVFTRIQDTIRRPTAASQ